MFTLIEGNDSKSICITTNGERDIIPCENSSIKLWLSSGTILGMEFNSKLCPNKWSIRVLYVPVNNNYIYRETIYRNSTYYSDLFETDEEVINYRLIPNVFYNKEEISL